jgi:4-hydroxy-tetrahydrodipicolinate reductase
MKIALIGNGKTGGAFRELAEKNHEVKVFTRHQPCKAADIAAVDAVVVFVPASGLADLSTMLMESGKPVICGTTGFPFDSLESPGAPWIVASNFSLGMNAAFLVAKLLNRLPTAESFHVHEVHHVHKKDSPSGTALYLKSLLPAHTTISAEREGDARGLHRLEVKLPGENLLLEHEAHDRSVFGAGALYALERMLPELPRGLFRFETLMESALKEELFRE